MQPPAIAIERLLRALDGGPQCGRTCPERYVVQIGGEVGPGRIGDLARRKLIQGLARQRPEPIGIGIIQ